MIDFIVIALLLILVIVTGYITAYIVGRPLPREGRHARYGPENPGQREVAHRVKPKTIKEPPAPPAR